jgi:hypothetical protein
MDNAAEKKRKKRIINSLLIFSSPSLIIITILPQMLYGITPKIVSFDYSTILFDDFLLFLFGLKKKRKFDLPETSSFSVEMPRPM